MNIRVKTTNVTLTPFLSDYVNRSLAKITKVVGGDPAVQCDIELARTTEHHQKGDIFRAEMHLVGSGLDEYAAVDGPDLNAAITGVRDEILGKLRAGKVKRISYMRRSGARVKAMMKGILPWGEKGWYKRRG
jgi:ribosomal subunit interface protein